MVIVTTHVGVPCRSKSEADRFFTNVLGLPQTRSFVVPSALSYVSFRESREVEVLVYEDGRTKVEVFVTPQKASSGYVHVGLEVEDLAGILERCAREGLECITVPRGDKQLHFVRDFSDNLYELTEKPRC
jgi:catechol 2,3-dioxygenase-like lactoylglutathione lyase family enzyme